MKRYRKTERGGGLFSAIEHEQAVAAKSTGILKLRDLIPWESFRRILEGQGLLAREGSIVDASFVEAPRQRNGRDQNRRIKQGERPGEFDASPAAGRQKDSEARWTKKNNEVHHGWKNHVKADLKTRLILNASTTPASVHDSRVFEELLDDRD